MNLGGAKPLKAGLLSIAGEVFVLRGGHAFTYYHQGNVCRIRILDAETAPDIHLGGISFGGLVLLTEDGKLLTLAFDRWKVQILQDQVTVQTLLDSAGLEAT